MISKISLTLILQQSTSNQNVLGNAAIVLGKNMNEHINSITDAWSKPGAGRITVGKGIRYPLYSMLVCPRAGLDG
jgi:hypothetical protein